MELTVELVAAIRSKLKDGAKPCEISKAMPELDEKDVLRVGYLVHILPSADDERVLLLAKFMRQWATAREEKIREEKH